MTDKLLFADTAYLTPAAIEVAVKGEILIIEPLKTRQLMTALPYYEVCVALARLASQLDADGGAADVEGAAEDAPAVSKALKRVMTVCIAGGQAVLDLACIAVGKPQGWLDDTNLLELAAVVLAVAEVNQDFFANARPLLSQLLPRGQKLLDKLL